jgi:hypothetical protein
MNAWATAATVSIVVSTRPIASSESGLMDAQVAERGEERRRVEERRQDRDQHDVRVEGHVRNARDEAEREPAEHEQDRVRQLQDRSQREQRGHGGEQPEQDERVLGGEVHAFI